MRSRLEKEIYITTRYTVHIGTASNKHHYLPKAFAVSYWIMTFNALYPRPEIESADSAGPYVPAFSFQLVELKQMAVLMPAPLGLNLQDCVTA
jgi:hypothetical protein